VFNRAYPSGTQAATTAMLTTPGDVAAWPLVRIYGPVTGPALSGTITPLGTTGVPYQMTFQPSFRVDAGQWVDIDNYARTIYRQSDPTQSALGGVNWASSTWLWVPPGALSPPGAQITLSGTSTSAITQAQFIYQDGYFT
jgi:hypothetical protein